MFKQISQHLFYKIGFLVIIFSLCLTTLIFITVEYYYTDQDTLLDAQELYFYSNMVKDWGVPPDTLAIKKDIKNLHYTISIFNQDTSLIWFYPRMINPGEYYFDLDSEDYDSLHTINFPLYASFGFTSEDGSVTYIKNKDYHYFIAVDSVFSSEYLNYIPPMIFSIMFILGLNYFMGRFLKPIKLIKDRLYRFRRGDLNSSIRVLGSDELADLSKSVNKMMEDMKILLNQKQRLLMDVSHELRSPLARMRLLVEMIPGHKNKDGLVDEIIFLEGMVSNLLLSDKLALPYSNLEFSSFFIKDLITIVIDLVNEDLKKFKIENLRYTTKITADKTKLIVAIRNIVDNALKYGDSSKPITIKSFEEKNYSIIKISNYGSTLSSKDIKKVFEPFYRLENKSGVGFGLGLTICKRIINAHGGTVGLNSKNNEITFTIKLPLTGTLE